MINVKGLSKTFGKNEVLTDINVSINEGAVVAVIGPSVREIHFPALPQFVGDPHERRCCHKWDGNYG